MPQCNHPSASELATTSLPPRAGHTTSRLAELDSEAPPARPALPADSSAVTSPASRSRPARLDQEEEVAQEASAATEVPRTPAEDAPRLLPPLPPDEAGADAEAEAKAEAATSGAPEAEEGGASGTEAVLELTGLEEAEGGGAEVVEATAAAAEGAAAEEEALL